MFKKYTLLVLALIYPCLWSCGRPHESTLQAQVDKLDSLPLTLENQPAWTTALGDSIGFLSTHCTVTHIGQGQAITAGHCINALSRKEENLPCMGIFVRWFSLPQMSFGAPVACDRIIVAINNNGLDYAILQFAEAPKVALSMADQAYPPLPGTKVTLLHLPHGVPSFSEGCEILSGPPLEHRIYHDCDTAPGSSGAALLIAGKIVGIHVGKFKGDEMAKNIASVSLSI